MSVEARVPDQNEGEGAMTGIHVAHCCKKHGCKYGDADCPVEHGFETQMAGCERCYYENQAREKAIILLTTTFNERMHAKFARIAPELMQEDGVYLGRDSFENEVDTLLDAGMLAVDF